MDASPSASRNSALRWAQAHKALTAVIATLTALVTLASGALALHDRLRSPSAVAVPSAAPVAGGTGPAATGLAPAAEAPGLTSSTLARLESGVQLSVYEQLLGPPLSRERLQSDEWLATSWESTDAEVTAFSDRDDQVVAYRITSLGPDSTPVVEHLPGGLRLRDSDFADVPLQPTGIAGIYPPNGSWSYTELHTGSWASQYLSTVLGTGFLAGADDEGALGLLALPCLPLSVFERALGCSPEEVQALREELTVTSMTVGELAVLEALAADGALFVPNPG